MPYLLTEFKLTVKVNCWFERKHSKFPNVFFVALVVVAKNHTKRLYIKEAMENFVFPDEIKTKLMKMNKLMNIFYAKEPNILAERA